jgi:hypothetical protein
MASPEQTRSIYRLRDKLMTASEGGMTLNLTSGAIHRTISTCAIGLANWHGVVIGAGDGLVPAIMLEHGAASSSGVEFNSFPGGGPQLASKRMVEAAGGQPCKVLWGTDVLEVTHLQELVDNHLGPIVAYGFDDSIPPEARCHWYDLLENNGQVQKVATTWHHALDLQELLPSFVQVEKFRVGMEGGNCSRTMLLLER